MNLEEYESFRKGAKTPKEIVSEDLITAGTLCLQNNDEKGADACFEKAGLNNEEIKKLKKENKAVKHRPS